MHKESRRAGISLRSTGGEDWATEYLDYVLSVKVVGGLDEAIGHINRYGSGHTDAIVTAFMVRFAIIGAISATPPSMGL